VVEVVHGVVLLATGVVVCSCTGVVEVVHGVVVLDTGVVVCSCTGVVEVVHGVVVVCSDTGVVEVVHGVVHDSVVLPQESWVETWWAGLDQLSPHPSSWSPQP
jgi:hypothetical protein